jgi:hypothetical protein
LDISDSSLYSKVIDWSNLLRAYRKAAKGKRGKGSAGGFEHQLADRLLELQRELTDFSYRPGGYVHFMILAPFRDRVVHHALCNVIEPIFEREFIPASRKTPSSPNCSAMNLHPFAFERPARDDDHQRGRIVDGLGNCPGPLNAAFDLAGVDPAGVAGIGI